MECEIFTEQYIEFSKPDVRGMVQWAAVRPHRVSEAVMTTR